jgi:hypothetical protein
VAVRGLWLRRGDDAPEAAPPSSPAEREHVHAELQREAERHLVRERARRVPARLTRSVDGFKRAPAVSVALRIRVRSQGLLAACDPKIRRDPIPPYDGRQEQRRPSGCNRTAFWGDNGAGGPAGLHREWRLAPPNYARKLPVRLPTQGEVMNVKAIMVLAALVKAAAEITTILLKS